MAKYLVIVESPAKVKTIQKFLGQNYEVAASNGHVRDLPKSTLGLTPRMIMSPNILPSEGRETFWPTLGKRRKKPIKSTWPPTLTGRGRLLPGICITP